jgi:hypothetical protein
MYLILPKDEALARNNKEAISRGCEPPTIYWWASTELADGTIALDVGDGEVLTDLELTMCVTEINNTNDEA